MTINSRAGGWTTKLGTARRTCFRSARGKPSFRDRQSYLASEWKCRSQPSEKGDHYSIDQHFWLLDTIINTLAPLLGLLTRNDFNNQVHMILLQLDSLKSMLQNRWNDSLGGIIIFIPLQPTAQATQKLIYPMEVTVVKPRVFQQIPKGW